jgi:hypothetical protein
MQTEVDLSTLFQYSFEEDVVAPVLFLNVARNQCAAI